ncbi:MAG: 3-deoxy-D-manno-octulosonic acid transferase [Flavobacteriaceae bacterium]|nr:3-deoxy-D-manno-octulosonic acid transferase [Flavobacteriaceae bacterium]
MFKTNIINSLIHTFLEVLLSFCALFFKKIAKGVKGRKKSFDKIKTSFSKNDKIIHIHCSSYGEYLMSEELTANLKKNFTDYKFLLSFISPSGYENANKSLFDCVIYLPLASDKNLKKFYGLISPKITLFIKNEIWPGYINYAKMYGSKVYSVGGNFQNNFFKKRTSYFSSSIKKLDTVFVVNENSKNLIENYGNKNVVICGDLRYDNVIPNLTQEHEGIISEFIDGKRCIVFGSTWEEDERLILKYINESERDLKYIIAPHEIGENCNRIKQKIKKRSILFSEIKSNQSKDDFSCLIIDNIGMLSSLYSYCTLAYVGGGMGTTGLHNTLEPASFGKPIIIGKNYKTFDEARMMIKNGGMISVSNNHKEFYNSFEKALSDKDELNRMSNSNSDYFKKQKGAINLILNHIKNE